MVLGVVVVPLETGGGLGRLVVTVGFLVVVLVDLVVVVLVVVVVLAVVWSFPPAVLPL